MTALTRLTATVGLLSLVVPALFAVNAKADGRRTVQTETGVIVADYTHGNIPPSDAIAVRPGQSWQGWLELDSDDAEMKYYVRNPNATPDDRPGRQYWARHIECGDPSDEHAFVTVTVDVNGVAIIRCDVRS